MLSVVSVYDQNRPNEDMVSSVVYYKNKIAVIIPNENNWNMQPIDSTHPRVEGWTQEQIDERYYGTIDLFDYFADR
ncbi:MAG: hypothetical protein MI867_17195 [Pseudomonadales bacterium]|nr:hypothetical protein [Pseudomonadales bacterium]